MNICPSSFILQNLTKRGAILDNFESLKGHLKISHIADKRKNFHMGGREGVWTQFVVQSTVKTKKKGRKKTIVGGPAVLAESDLLNKKCWDTIGVSPMVLAGKSQSTSKSKRSPATLLFEQRRFGRGCPSPHQVKWQEENEKTTGNSYFSLLLKLTRRSTWQGGLWMPG